MENWALFQSVWCLAFNTWAESIRGRTQDWTIRPSSYFMKCLICKDDMSCAFNLSFPDTIFGGLKSPCIRSKFLIEWGKCPFFLCLQTVQFPSRLYFIYSHWITGDPERRNRSPYFHDSFPLDSQQAVICLCYMEQLLNTRAKGDIVYWSSCKLLYNA